MQTHEQLVAKLMRRPGVRKEVERIEREEGDLLDILLKARHDAGMTQAQVAKRMGTQPPAVARQEWSSPEVEGAWDTEILKRIGEYERGEATLSPAADVFAEARRLAQ